MTNDTTPNDNNVGEFIDNIGRELFNSRRYDELDTALGRFFQSRAAGYVSLTKTTFYEQRLPGLISNYLFPQHADLTGHGKWLEDFPNLIRNYCNDDVCDINSKCILSQYLQNCSRRNMSMIDIISVVETTIQTFVTQHPEFKKRPFL